LNQQLYCCLRSKI